MASRNILPNPRDDYVEGITFSRKYLNPLPTFTLHLSGCLRSNGSGAMRVINSGDMIVLHPLTTLDESGSVAFDCASFDKISRPGPKI